ncbi:MAG: hypothetical protein AAFY84_18560 [Pseudomonadota bacterium]
MIPAMRGMTTPQCSAPMARQAKEQAKNMQAARPFVGCSLHEAAHIARVVTVPGYANASLVFSSCTLWRAEKHSLQDAYAMLGWAAQSAMKQESGTAHFNVARRQRAAKLNG